MREERQLQEHAADVRRVREMLASRFTTLAVRSAVDDGPDHTSIEVEAADDLDVGLLAGLLRQATAGRARVELSHRRAATVCIRIAKPAARHWAVWQPAVALVLVVALAATWIWTPQAMSA